MNKVKNTKRKHSILDIFSYSKENNYKLSIQLLNKKGKSRNSQCAFTLVELIVVITILAILWTIAFISLQWYSSQSRDSVRLSDISTMKSWLELFSLDAWKYPIPSEWTMITYSWSLAWTQWYFWGEVVTNLDKLDKVLLDPLTKKEYVYSTTSTRWEFQIAGAMEWDEVSVVNRKNLKLDSVLASEKTARLIISWTYNGKVLRVGGCWIDYLLAVPSIITSSLSTLEFISANKLLAYNGYKNLPFQYEWSYKTDWETDLNLVNTWSIVVFSWDIDILSDMTLSWQIERADLLTKLQTAYGNTNISSVWEIDQILNVTEPNQIEELATAILSNNLRGSILSCITSSWTRTVYWDEDADSISACNKWVETAIWSSAWWYQNWVWVPAKNFITDWHWTPLTDPFYQRAVTYNGVDYICNWFAVMKYEAKFTDTSDKSHSWGIDYWNTWRVNDYETDNDLYPLSITGWIVSKADDFPIAYIRQWEAIQACWGLTYSWTVSHLITNNEWMAMARNIESQAVNWSWWSVWSGWIYRWNVGLTDNLSYRSYVTTFPYHTKWAWIDSDTRWTNEIWNRRLLLSNNQNIWDLSWNVREQVNKSNVPATSNIRTSNSWWNTNVYSTEAMCSNWLWWERYGWNWSDSGGISACNMINGYTISSYGPLNNINADNGAWRLFATNVEEIINVIMRGGGGSLGLTWGIFSLYTGRNASTYTNHVGFRCSW